MLSLYDTNPNFMHYYKRKIPQNCHTFAVFDLPKMGNLMNPVLKEMIPAVKSGV